jgi:CRP-like cAMP-binding protein
MIRQLSSEQESMATRVALHPFLVGLDREKLALLTDCALSAAFQPGEIILQEGEPAKRFYLIETGMIDLEASVSAKDSVVIDKIAPGQLLGWSWMFPPYVWRFTARAVERTRAIFFSGEILRQYCERNQSLGYDLFKRMAPVMIKRMQNAREKMVAMHTGNAILHPVVHAVGSNRGKSPTPRALSQPVRS